MERTFAGAGHASGRKARTLSDIGATDVRVGVDAFLQKLPERTIVNGQPVDVREAVKARLAPPARQPAPVAAEADRAPAAEDDEQADGQPLRARTRRGLLRRPPRPPVVARPEPSWHIEFVVDRIY